jgi:hypothetical protein
MEIPARKTYRGKQNEKITFGVGNGGFNHGRSVGGRRAGPEAVEQEQKVRGLCRG